MIGHGIEVAIIRAVSAQTLQQPHLEHELAEALQVHGAAVAAVMPVADVRIIAQVPHWRPRGAEQAAHRVQAIVLCGTACKDDKGARWVNDKLLVCCDTDQQ